MTAYEEFLCNQFVKEEVNKVQRELEVYKKALALLDRSDYGCPSVLLGDKRECIEDCNICIKRYYNKPISELLLEKVREE